MGQTVTLEEILTPFSGKERCGVWTSSAFFELENTAAEPTLNYNMSAFDINAINFGSDSKVVGVWHSHPNGQPEPSKTDIDFHPVGYKMAIVCDGLWREYDADGGWLASYGPQGIPGFNVAFTGPMFGFGHTGDFLPESTPPGTCVVCGDPGPRPMVFKLSKFCCGVCELVLAGDLPPAAAAQARAERRADMLGT